MRVVHRDEPAIDTTRGGYARNASARARVHLADGPRAADLVAARSRLGRHDVGREPVAPGHVAVLVHTQPRRGAGARRARRGRHPRRHQRRRQRVRHAAGARVAAAARGARAARRRAPRAHAAALTPFLGWSAERIAARRRGRLGGRPPAPARLGARAARQRRRVAHRDDHARRGAAGAGAAAADGERAADRPAPRRPAAARRGDRPSSSARPRCVAWLRRRIAEADQDTSDEDRSRRLESDAEAVQVLTVHRSKGLEFPIVYYPYLWEPGYIPTRRAGRLPRPRRGRPAHDRRRARGRGLQPPQAPAPDRAARGGPAARLRRADARPAPGRRVVGALVRTAATRALGRLLFARKDDGTRAADGRFTPTDDGARRALRGARRGSAPGCISVERVAARAAGAPWSGPLRAPAELLARALRPRARPPLAADLVQRHHARARTRRGWRASPRSRCWTTSRRRRCAPLGARRTTRRCRPSPSLLGGDAGRHRASARSCTGCSRRPTSPPPTSRRS